MVNKFNMLEIHLAKLKVDERGRLVDITTLSPYELRKLIEYYETKLRRAKSSIMKQLYHGILLDLKRYMISGLVPTRVDALTFARYMGIKSVKWFIEYYWKGSCFTPEDPKILYIENFSKRRANYKGVELPPDDLKIEIFKLNDAGQIHMVFKKLAKYYSVPCPTIVEKEDLNLDLAALYDPVTRIIIFNLAKIENSLDKFALSLRTFFQHLSNMKGWRFSEDIEGHIIQEKIEAKRFCESILEELVRLGYLKKKA